MAVLTKQTFTSQTNVVTKTDLNAGPHSLTWSANTYLVFDNSEVGSITVNIVGDGVTTKTFTGYGDVTVSTGFDVVVGAGSSVVVPLNTISAYLGDQLNNVTLAVTGSTAPNLAFVYLR